MEYDRIKESTVDPKERVKNYNEFTLEPENEKLQEQGRPLHGLWRTILP